MTVSSYVYYAVLGVVLFLILAYYVLLAIITNSNALQKAGNAVTGGCAPMSLVQKEEFVRSRQRTRKIMLLQQGVLMVIAAALFIMLNFDTSPVFAMFCICKAVADFYFSHKVEVL